MKTNIIDILPQGIIRNEAPTNSQPGNCEYVTNLRPCGNTWRPIGPKAQPFASLLPADNRTRKMYLHQMQHQTVMLLLRFVEEQKAQIIWTLLPTDEGTAADDTVWNLLAETETDSRDTLAMMQISFTSCGNYLTVNTPTLRTYLFTDNQYTSCQNDTTTPPVPCLRVEGRYTDNQDFISNFVVGVRGTDVAGRYMREYATTQTDESLLDVDNENCVVMDMDGQTTPKKWADLTFDSDASAMLLKSLAGQYEAMTTADSQHREGWVLACCAWQLADGSITCHTEPQLLHLGCQDIANDFKNQLGRDFEQNTDIDVFYNRDKVYIKRFVADGLSQDSAVDAKFTCRVRRQWVQKLICSRPEIPQGLSKSVCKAVYFVSQPLSMYNIELADFAHLHTTYHYDVSSSGGLIEGGAADKSYYRLALRRGQTDAEGLPEQMPSPQWIENAVMYRAAEFDITELNDNKDKTVDFMNLSTADTLPVDSTGHLERRCAGLMTYCQRLHIWNVTSRFAASPLTQSLQSVPMPGWRYEYIDNQVFDGITRRDVQLATDHLPYQKAVLQQTSAQTQTFYAIFRINLGNSYIYHCRTLQAQTHFKNSADVTMTILTPVLTFADSRADRCTLVMSCDDGAYYATSLKMKPSAVANFAYALTIDVSDKDTTTPSLMHRSLPLAEADTSQPVTAEMIEMLQTLDGQTLDSYPATGSSASEGLIAEPRSMQVSALANPLVFAPENTFTFDHDVVCAAVQCNEISSAQAGQYPTAVFTTAGIWSMLLGQKAFYSQQVPIATDVCISPNVVGTPLGLVFISKAGVMALHGRTTTLLTEKSSGDIMYNLGRSSALSEVCDGHPNQLVNAGAYRQFRGKMLAEGVASIANSCASLGYDRNHRELLLSNYYADCPTSYVMNVDTKKWYSISCEYYSVYSDYGVRKPDSISGLTNCQIQDLTNEDWGDRSDATSVPVMLMTRPLTFDNVAYTHMRRLSLYGQLWIGQTNLYSGVYVLASNELQHFTIAQALQWNQDTTKLRLERTHWSWRYYVVLMLAQARQDFAITHMTVEQSNA